MNSIKIFFEEIKWSFSFRNQPFALRNCTQFSCSYDKILKWKPFTVNKSKAVLEKAIGRKVGQ